MKTIILVLALSLSSCTAYQINREVSAAWHRLLGNDI